MTHTPGPWTIETPPAPSSDEPPQNDACCFSFISSPDWSEFARVVTRMWGDDTDSPVGLANAHLIVSAPDLLAALKSLEQALRKDSRDKTISRDTVEYHLDGNAMYHAINSVRNAINKAEGRA